MPYVDSQIQCTEPRSADNRKHTCREFQNCQTRAPAALVTRKPSCCGDFFRDHFATSTTRLHAHRAKNFTDQVYVKLIPGLASCIQSTQFRTVTVGDKRPVVAALSI